MRANLLTGFVVIAFAASAVCEPPDLSKMPKPQKEHEWLQQLVGNWDDELEMYFEEGKPPIKATGTDTTKSLGGFWVVTDFQCKVMDMPMNGVITIGFDPKKKKYVGTGVDSMTSHMWTFEGTVDSTGKILSWETEGPCPQKGGKIVKFKESIELKSKDEKVITSSFLDDNGKWVPMMVIHGRRK